MASVTLLIETRHLPPFTVGGAGGGGGGGAFASAVARLLKPRVRAQLGGATLADLAPYGAPGPSTWPGLAVAAGIVGVLLVVLVVRGAAAFLAGK